MTILELSDPPQCQVGSVKGRAHWLIDYGPHADVLFGVVLDDTGEVWWTPTHKLTISLNWSLGRVEKKKLSAESPRSDGDTAVVPYQVHGIPVGPEAVDEGYGPGNVPLRGKPGPHPFNRPAGSTQGAGGPPEAKDP